MMKILLIEDDPIHARLILRAFGDDGEHQLAVVRDGDEALKRLTGRPEPGDQSPDLVLLDLCLPTIDGCEVLQTLRGSAMTKNLPVIMLSTSNRPEDIQRCYKSGANAYVTKPADYDGLANKLHSIREFWLSAAELPGPTP